ncbi:hypothetical protein RvY_18506-2 [Ramazzottius varieornatus]|uniref:Uncharacterized protein n=1 Tax=Ramazzottius varieornatus TaxID=947166 RepID=A0A1D1W607_RAMVA|nr:hypothetical protein RvY_18506-2 [Ramazzottius varieornatus]
MASDKLPPPEPSLTFHGSEGTVSCMRYKSEGLLAGRLFSGSTHTFVYVWDLVSTKKLSTKFRCDELAEKNDTVLSIIPSARTSDEVSIQVRNGSLHKWRLAESTPVRLQDRQLFVAHESGDVLLWDIRSPSLPVFVSSAFRTSSPRSVHCDEDFGALTPLALDVDTDRDLLIVGGTSNLLRRFKITPTGLDPLDSTSLSTSGVSDVKIRPDNKIVTVSSWDFTARIYSWKALKPLAVLDMHKDTVQCIEYAMVRERNCVVLGGKDGLISVWPLY